MSKATKSGVHTLVKIKSLWSLGALTIFGSFTIFSCDNQSKMNDNTRNRDAAALAAKSSDAEDEEDSQHEHPIYEKEKKSKTKPKDEEDAGPTEAPASKNNPAPQAPTPAPAKPPAPTAPSPGPSPSPNPAPSPNPPAADPEIAKRKAMYDANKMLSSITIEANNPMLDPTSTMQRWFTSDAKPITCYAAVDAAGALMVPAGVAARQIDSGTPAAPTDTKFRANNVDVATLHSSCRVCNNSGVALYLHSGNTGAFSHGAGAFANGTCVQFLVERLVSAPTATYDHVMGNAQTTVAFKIVKVGPDGKIVP